MSEGAFAARSPVMQLLETAGPSGVCQEVEDAQIAPGEPALDAIFTCKYPQCGRQYASTDGVRKHCRKSHPEWLREVDLDKANHGCRWAAYCTREAITEGHDPRTTPVGSKRAREILAQHGGGGLPPVVGGLGGALSATGTKSFGAESSSSRQESFGTADEAPKLEPKAPRLPPHQVAMDGKSALVPLRPFPSAPERSSASENMMPPEMIALPGELSTPLPVNVSALTPNAQARQRLGEIADSESICLQGGTAPALPSSPSVDSRDVQALQPHGSMPHGANSFFMQWGMPPLKRGISLADTREIAATHAMLAAEGYLEQEEHSQDSPSFLDSVLA